MVADDDDNNNNDACIVYTEKAKGKERETKN